MYEGFLYIITFLYAGAGIIGVAGFFPTMKDLLIDKRNRANPKPYLMWIGTNLIATLYGGLIMKNLIFTTISGLSCLCCSIICLASIYLSKKGIRNDPPSL